MPDTNRIVTPLLTIDGEVQTPLALSQADLQAISQPHQITDVAALIPSRRGQAVWLEGLLAQASVKPAATHLTLHASKDDFHASIPLAAIANRALVIYALDGGPLPASAGGPVRFFILDHAACHSAEIDECANVKFIDRIELTAGKGQDNRPQDETSHAALHAKA